MQYVIRYKKSKTQKMPTERMLVASTDVEALQKEAKRDPNFTLTNIGDYVPEDHPEIKMRFLNHKNILHIWKW